MKDRELEKLLKSFHKVKAPRELDERLSPYMKKKQRWSLVPVYAVLLVTILGIVYGILGKREAPLFMYEPLYAAHTVLGYYEVAEPVNDASNIRVVVDGEAVVDSFYTDGDTVRVLLELSPGLHYVIIESYDLNGDFQKIRAIDLYSL